MCAETGESWSELSIEDDPALFDEYWERIPVVLVDGRPHDFWRIDANRLRTALTPPRHPITGRERPVNFVTSFASA